MRRTRRRRKLHSDEKILLLISEHSGKRELWDVPRDLTQKGISTKLEILENNVSRALKRLLKDELVESELKHVKGEKRRQKAYFPTQKGREVIEGIKQDLEEMVIDVLSDNETNRMGVLSAYKRSREAGLRTSLAEIYLISQRDHGSLDLRSEGKINIQEEPMIGSYHMPNHFYGREKELEKIVDFLGSKTGVMLVWGLAGMGKTTLILKAMNDSRRRSAYIRCESWTDSAELMNDLSSIMDELGLEDASDKLSTGDLTPGALSRTLKEAADDLKGLTIVIDDLQKTGGGIDIFIEGLCRASMDSRNLKMVILTRERPTFLDPRDELHGAVRSMELKGLDPRAVGYMLKDLGMGGDIGAIWDLTKGHPLFIELYISSIDSGYRAGFSGFMDKEIFSKLPGHQRKALQLAALADHPVHRTLLSSISSEDLDMVQRKGFIREVEPGMFHLHDLLSDHIRGMTGAEARTDLIKEITAYRTAVLLRIWDDGPGMVMDKDESTVLPTWIMDRMVENYSTTNFEDEPGLRKMFKQHLDSNISMLIDIGEKKGAFNLLRKLASKSGRGRGKVLYGPIARLERSKIEEDDLFSLRLMKAELEISEKDIKNAKRTLSLISATYPETRIEGKERAVLQHLKGMISRHEKRYDDTINAHMEALATYDKIGDQTGSARERLHLAKALDHAGMAEEAFKEAIKSASEFKGILDRKGEVYACLQAFRSAIDLGKEGAAEKCLERAFEVSGYIKDVKLMSMIELERMIFKPKDAGIQGFEKIEDNLDDLDMIGLSITAKGLLRVSEGILKPSIRIRCLKTAVRTFKQLSKKRDGSDLESVYERYLLAVGIIEHLGELHENTKGKDRKAISEGFGTFIGKKKGEDMETALLARSAELYDKIIKTCSKILKEGMDMDMDVDGVFEGAVHSFIACGIRYKEIGDESKARRMFSKSRKAISNYERLISKYLDKKPGFDIRKIKEILEENRNALEESSQ